MERLNEMKEYILPKWSEQFDEDQGKIQTYFNRHKSEIVFRFYHHIVNKLITKTKDESSDDGQNERTVLIISHLYSSLLTRSYEYEISLCNKMLYVDKNMITSFWQPEFLYQYAADEELFLKKELQKKFIRLKKYEIEMLRLDLFTQYWEKGRMYFKEIIDEMRENKDLNKINPVEFKFFYGEHMGELKEFI